MEWKYLFLISAYSLTACDSVLGASTIINVTLVDGESPNEGRVEILRSDASTWDSLCGDGINNSGASVICRELGYPGVNNLITVSPFGTSSSLAQLILNCDGTEDNLADCQPLVQTSFCTHAGGVICYESGYIGCYTTVVGALQIPCENGVQDLTIPKCVSLCHHTSDTYTYAGLHQGNMCYCWSASATVSHMDKVEDRLCSSPCVGRDIETCGGDPKIALFNISLYLQNTKRTASPPGCAEPTPTQTEGDETTTVSIQPSSTLSPLPSSPSSSSSQSTSPSPSSPPPTSPSVPSTDRTTMEQLTTTVHAVSETDNPIQSTRELVTTNMYSTFSSGTSTQSENCTCIQKAESSFSSVVSKGVQIGLIVVVVALLLYAVAITFLLIQLRRKVPTRTGENEPDPYMDLQPRPEADRTYQEMAITSTASSKKPGERRVPSSHLIYENQKVAQYANKIKEGADYEDVHTPN